MSAELFPKISNFEVLDFDPLLSDIHSPLVFDLIANSKARSGDEVDYTSDDCNDDSFEQSAPKPKWKADSHSDFVNHVNQTDVSQILEVIDSLYQNVQCTIDDITITTKVSGIRGVASQPCCHVYHGQFFKITVTFDYHVLCKCVQGPV